MPLRQGHAHAASPGPGLTRVVIEGVAAMVALVAISAAVFALLIWSAVWVVLRLAI